MSHYAEYIKEREGYEIIENDDGFASFCQINNSVYLRDVYVMPEKRMFGVGKSFVSVAEQWGREKGLDYIITTVKPSAKGSTLSLKATLGAGFELVLAETDAIYFRKSLKAGG